QAIQHREGDFVMYIPGVDAKNDKVSAKNTLARILGCHSSEDIHDHRGKPPTRRYHKSLWFLARRFHRAQGRLLDREFSSLCYQGPPRIHYKKGKLGLIRDQAKFDQYWEGLEHKLPGKRSLPCPLEHRVVPISLCRCLGVWDTVGKLNVKGRSVLG
ncbi:hypothetical protein FRC10_007435, partial [Ceratobasidium sp. 414]